MLTLFFLFTNYRRLYIIKLAKCYLNRFTLLRGDGGMYMIIERKEPSYKKRNNLTFKFKKLKENVRRVSVDY